MHGGYRQGSGRKKGFAAKDAEQARRYLAERVLIEIEPLVDVLIDKAKAGDLRALQVLMDRAWGKPQQELNIFTSESEKAQQPDGRIVKLAKMLNEVR
jgi:hypothetical protein